jgi:hypothetical protein
MLAACHRPAVLLELATIVGPGRRPLGCDLHYAGSHSVPVASDCIPGTESAGLRAADAAVLVRRC